MKIEKNTNNQQEFKAKSKSFFEVFEKPFFAIPGSLRKIRMSLSKNAMILHEYLLEQFANPTNRNRTYIHISFDDLIEEFKDCMKRSSIYKAMEEIENIDSGFLIYDLGKNKGKFYFIDNSDNQKLFEEVKTNKIKLVLDKTFRAVKIDNLINLFENKNPQLENYNPKSWITNPQIQTSSPQIWTTNPQMWTTEGVKKQPQLLDWSSLEADLEKITKEVNKEVYKESYHKEVSSLAAKVDTQAIKNEMMNDDLYNKIEKKEEDKISNFYLSEMIDLGIYDYKAKEYISKLSTDDIQKAFDKLEAAKDSGHYIKNEGNFIRETLEAFINPSFKPKFSIQEKEVEVLPIPAPIRKDNPNELEIRLNEYLEFFIPNITKVIHGFDTKVDEFNKKLINKFNAYILETYSEDQELNNNRDRFIAQIQELKKDSNNKVKDIVYLSINNPFLNKKTDSGKRVLDLFLEWFEGV